jgi:hypothetical protein
MGGAEVSPVQAARHRSSSRESFHVVLARLQQENEQQLADLRSRNTEAMHRVHAACLPQPVAAARHGRPESNEPDSSVKESGSTTTSPCGGSRGCGPDGTE